MSEEKQIDTKVKDKTIKIPLWIAVLALVVCVVIGVLVTFSLTVRNYIPAQSSAAYRIQKLSDLLKDSAYFEYDEEKMTDAALKAYMGATGDKYAVYYNEEEYKLYNESNSGSYVGIGVTFTQSKIPFEERDVDVFLVTKIHKGSPAETAGLLEGDSLRGVLVDGAYKTVDEFSDSNAVVSAIRGEEGTFVQLLVIRDGKALYLQVERKKIMTDSVTWHVCAADPAIAVVAISEFDLRTHLLLSSAMDEITEQGIHRVIFDLRDNGGGDLASVVACACYFLSDDDLILTREDNDGSKVEYRAVTRGGTCPVTSKDIGKYKTEENEYVLLVNGNTASAAEIFTSVFRDYELGTIIGTLTYGKGIVQSVYNLPGFGGVKFTTSVYYPPCGECYHGIGITPHQIVGLPDGFVIGEEAEADDPQIKAAVQYFNQ